MKELVAKINAEYEVFGANAAAQVEISKLMKEFRKVSVEAAK